MYLAGIRFHSTERCTIDKIEADITIFVDDYGIDNARALRQSMSNLSSGHRIEFAEHCRLIFRPINAVLFVNRDSFWEGVDISLDGIIRPPLGRIQFVGVK